ncbi:MAG TPA: hypothetical protein VF885_22815 [Arthrobacter sp.]
MTRKDERAQIKALIEGLPIFPLTHYEKTKVITVLLDSGFRYNPTVLREAAGALQKADPASPVAWLRTRAAMEEEIPHGEERARLNALIEGLPIFGMNDQTKTKLITGLFDGGFRYNPTILREAADALQKTDPASPSAWLRTRATTMEDTLCLN